MQVLFVIPTDTLVRPINYYSKIRIATTTANAFPVFSARSYIAANVVQELSIAIFLRKHAIEN